MASATSEDHHALAGRLMLPKGMAEVAGSLRSLVKVWVASERESVVKLEGGGSGYQYKLNEGGQWIELIKGEVGIVIEIGR